MPQRLPGVGLTRETGADIPLDSMEPMLLVSKSRFLLCHSGPSIFWQRLMTKPGIFHIAGSLRDLHVRRQDRATPFLSATRQPTDDAMDGIRIDFRGCGNCGCSYSHCSRRMQPTTAFLDIEGGPTNLHGALP